MKSYIHWLREKVGHETVFFNASLAIIPNMQGFVLLQKRDPKGQWWGLPGGGMEIGESIEQTLLREVMEETALKVEIDYFLGLYTRDNISTYPNGDTCHFITAVFVCKPTSEVPTIDATETYELKYTDPKNPPRLFGNRVPDALKDFTLGRRNVID